MRLEKVVVLAAQAVAVAECELVDVAYLSGGRDPVIQILVDRAGGGPTVAHCAQISRQLGRSLEMHDVVPGRYRLEVSSPGLNRPLKTYDALVSRANYVRFSGKLVVLKTVRPLPFFVDAQESTESPMRKGRSVFKGYLQGMEADDVLVQVEGALCRIPVDQIKKAHLEFEF